MFAIEIIKQIKMDLKNKVDELIGKSSKSRLSKYLGISKPTLDARIKNGNWTFNEKKLIHHAGVEQKVIYDKRDQMF